MAAASATIGLPVGVTSIMFRPLVSVAYVNRKLGIVSLCPECYENEKGSRLYRLTISWSACWEARSSPRNFGSATRRRSDESLDPGRLISFVDLLVLDRAPRRRQLSYYKSYEVVFRESVPPYLRNSPTIDMKLATAGCSKRESKPRSRMPIDRSNYASVHAGLGHAVRCNQIIQARNASYTSNPNTLYPLPPPGRPAPAPGPSSPAKQTKQADSKPVANNEIVSTLPKPRLDYRKIAETQKAVTLNHVIRNSPCPTDTVFHITRLYETSNSLHRKLDSVRAKQRDVGNLIKAGGGDEAVRQAKKLKLKVVEYEKILEETDKELLELGLMLPNETHPATPVGKEKEAIELERFGPEPISADRRRDHLDIAVNWGWVDPAASATATGTSWPYLKGQLALLEQALIQYSLSIAVKKGWTPVATPDVVKEDVMARCGFQPRDGAGQTYYLSTSPPNSDPDAPPPAGNQANLVLAATAEIPLAALTANKIIPYSSLPLKYVGLGKAFRAEAGARGADTRGLYRLHQFQKVELFALTEGENKVSEAMMEEMREMQKEIYTSLGLSVR